MPPDEIGGQGLCSRELSGRACSLRFFTCRHWRLLLALLRHKGEVDYREEEEVVRSAGGLGGRERERG